MPEMGTLGNRAHTVFFSLSPSHLICFPMSVPTHSLSAFHFGLCLPAAPSCPLCGPCSGHFFCVSLRLYCPCCFPLHNPCDCPSLGPLPSPPGPSSCLLPASHSLQAQGAGAAEGARTAAQEAAVGVHRPAAAHANRHIQGEQAAVEGDAGHHLAAARPRAQHCQQLLHERAAPLHEPLGRGARRCPRGPGCRRRRRHNLLQGLRRPHPRRPGPIPSHPTREGAAHPAPGTMGPSSHAPGQRKPHPPGGGAHGVPPSP